MCAHMGLWYFGTDFKNGAFVLLPSRGKVGHHGGMEAVKKIKTIVHVEPEQRAALEKMQQKHGAPISELIRRAIEMFLKAEDKKK